MTGFDSIQVRFQHTTDNKSPLANTRVVPFVESYLEILKSVIEDVRTDYFWFFSNFVDVSDFDFDFIPEQHESTQIHVWYNQNTNKEGNLLLIPTSAFKQQIKQIKFLRDYEDINYHEDHRIAYNKIEKVLFDLEDPYDSYNKSSNFYKWMINKDLKEIQTPDFYPSFWEDEKIYSWGKTKDIMLVPSRSGIDQFYDIDRQVHFDYEYSIKPMDIVFISYDEPSAEVRFNELKKRFPRAKWSKGVSGQTLAYRTAADLSSTDYFFAVFPKLEVVDTFEFDFQPDRMKNPCHYIFNCKNPVNGLVYGHGAVLLYNKKLVRETVNPGLDFTLSAAHDWVPELSAINHFNETPWLAWRTAFREVIKLLNNPTTVENQFRLKKWCTIGEGKNGEWSLKGAMDADAYHKHYGSNHEKLMLSYDWKWLKEHYDTKYKDSVR
jgi:hypothetical protein|tara:strand:+ start:347 stop:1651 length:1305 start_codon:yes stop_codon:yes gene_type:complete